MAQTSLVGIHLSSEDGQLDLLIIDLEDGCQYSTRASRIASANLGMKLVDLHPVGAHAPVHDILPTRKLHIPLLQANVRGVVSLDDCQGHSSLDAPSELNPPQRIPSPLSIALLVPQAKG